MEDGQSLSGRVALVTGAGRGIGRAHALTLADAGAAVVVNDLGCSAEGEGADAAPAFEVVAEITAAGGNAVADGSDIGSLAGAAGAVEATVRRFGRIDIVVNNAGIVTATGLDDLTEEELDLMFAVHLKGTVGTMRAAVPYMRRQHHGRIINTVSEVALDTRRGTGVSPYGIAKAAVWSATVAGAMGVADDGITVNAISPGARTRMNEAMLDASAAKLDLDPFHVARVAAYLASDAAGDITGRVLHAAAGQLREYTVTRSGDTALVERVGRALGLAP